MLRKALLIACALLLWTGMAGAQDWIRYYPPATFTGGTVDTPLLLPDGTAAAPSLGFSSNTDMGMYYLPGIGRFCTTENGTPYACFSNGIKIAGSGGSLQFGTANAYDTADLFLYRDAANTLALRNGGTAGTPVPQTVNLYNFCDGAACVTGYERGYLGFASNELRIGTAAAGTGAVRQIALMSQYVTLRGSLGLVVETSDQTNFGEALRQPKTLYLARSIEGSKSKALTAGAATNFVVIAIPQTALVNFASGKVIWNVRASNATDIQTLQGESSFNCVNKADTETCAAIVTYGATAVAASAGAAADDIACTITAVTGLTDSIALAANCATAEMTETSLSISYRLDMPQPNTVTPQ